MFVPAVALLAAGCGGGHDLTYRAKPGDRRGWKRTYTIEGTSVAGSAGILATELYTEETVVEAVRRGGVTVRHEFRRTTASARKKGAETGKRFDSADPATAPEASLEKGTMFGRLAWAVGRLPGGAVLGTLTPDGRIDAFPDIDGLATHLLAGLPEDPPAAPPVPGSPPRTEATPRQVAISLADTALLRFHLQPPFKVPMRRLQVGETWSMVDIRPGPAETIRLPCWLYYRGEGKFESVEDGVARVVVTGHVTLDPPKGAPPPPANLEPFLKMLRLAKGSFSGEVRIRPETGELLSGRMETDLDLYAVGAPAQAPGEDGEGSPAAAPAGERAIPQRMVQVLERWDPGK